jgi:hypothetical protein
VPAVSRIAELLPHGFSVKGSPVKRLVQKSVEKKIEASKPLTFAERLRLAKERATK